MLTSKPFDTKTSNPADQAAQSADNAIKSTQRAANNALDSLSSTVQDVRDQAVPAYDRLKTQTEDLAHRSMDALRDTTRQVRDTAVKASDQTVNYIKDEPFKAVLIAAATGAALMALVSLMSRSRDR